jgi:hypothetical protein
VKMLPNLFELFATFLFESFHRRWSKFLQKSRTDTRVKQNGILSKSKPIVGVDVCVGAKTLATLATTIDGGN